MCLATSAGCSGDKTKARVTGTVTVDGKKAAEGAVTFIPLDGRAPTTGAMIENGKYSALVPFGLMRVEIRVPKVVGEKKLYDEPNSPTMPVKTESLPDKYNAKSELQLEVKPGGIARDFELTTQE